MAATKNLNLVEASIHDLLHALNIGAITSVELVSLYLHRIGQYDCRGPTLNSVCVLNPNVFEEAQASDDFRASGSRPRPLEGIPFTVKDSFKVKGMPVAAGSLAFAGLEASEDAAIVKMLRNAGAIVLGRTNMPAMADGGSQRGLFGRSESPYNLKYLTTACASGSSNGCGTSTACSFAAFGLAGETVSSGRAPASNNALVGYSPSRGLIPSRGQWPLYPTCDVIVPQTRCVTDMLAVLNTVVADDLDAETGIDFWRNQKHVTIPEASGVRPEDYLSLCEATALKGKRVAVPKLFLGTPGPWTLHFCSESVRDLWNEARGILEAEGATVVETDFPLYEEYTRQDSPGQNCNVPGMPPRWPSVERCDMIATAWDDFLRQNGDEKQPSLLGVDPNKIRPLVAPMDDPAKHTEAKNQVRYRDMIEIIKKRKHSLYNFPGSREALQSLETMRKTLLEDWMETNSFDLLAFPTNGDVGKADADETLESMTHAIRDGVKYSNGGRLLKHLGIPCITLPMGTMKDKGMPVGITLVSKAYDDTNLLRYAYAFEVNSRLRQVPPLTPPLGTDKIPMVIRSGIPSQAKPWLDINSSSWTKSEDSETHKRVISISGALTSPDTSISIQSLRCFVNGEMRAEPLVHDDGKWHYADEVSRPKRYERFPTLAPVPKYHFLVVILAKLSNGRTTARLIEID